MIDFPSIKNLGTFNSIVGIERAIKAIATSNLKTIQITQEKRTESAYLYGCNENVFDSYINVKLEIIQNSPDRNVKKAWHSCIRNYMIRNGIYLGIFGRNKFLNLNLSENKYLELQASYNALEEVGQNIFESHNSVDLGNYQMQITEDEMEIEREKKALEGMNEHCKVNTSIRKQLNELYKKKNSTPSYTPLDYMHFAFRAGM